MDSLVQDVLNANIVFLGVELMNKPDGQRYLEEVADGEVLGMDVGFSMTAGGAPEPSRRIVLQRDRISIEVASARSSITVEYPPRDFAKVDEITARALAGTAPEGEEFTYGYNMTLVLAPELAESALKHLGHHLFSSQPLGQDSWERVGGFGTLYFWDNERRWTFSVEPRPRDDAQSKRFFMSVNLHLSNVDLPMEGVVAATFVEILDEATNFMNQIIVGE